MLLSIDLPAPAPGVPVSAVHRQEQPGLAPYFQDAGRPWFGAAGNGVVDDTNAFRVLEESVHGRAIDGEGLTYRVQSIPRGNYYHRGWWLIEDFEPGLDARLPWHETLTYQDVQVTANPRYSAWPQDKAHTFKGQGTSNRDARELLFVAWNEGSGHKAPDQHVVLATSYDGGRTWPVIEHPFQSLETSRASFSFGQVDGQQLLIVRNPETETHDLYGRRLFEVREMVSPDDGATFRTQAGRRGVSVTLAHPHGLKKGDRVRLANFEPLDGLRLSGTHAVTSVRDGYTFEIEPGPEAAASGTTVLPGRKGRVPRITFLQDAFQPIMVGGSAFGTAVARARGSPWQSGDGITLFHSFAAVPGSAGDFHTAAHGNGKGSWLVSVTGTLTDSPTVRLEQIGGAGTPGVEATLARDHGTGELYGTLRSQSATAYPLRLWHRSAAGDYRLHDFPDHRFATKVPMPLRIKDGRIFGYVTSTRTRTGSAGPIHQYFVVWNSLNEFRDQGFAAARFFRFGSLYLSNTNQVDSTNALGVGSLDVLEDGTLALFFSDEHPPVQRDLDGQPNIYCTLISTAQLIPQAGLGYQEAHGPGARLTPSTPEQRYDEIQAETDPGGTIQWQKNNGSIQLACHRTAAGTYEFRFLDPQGRPTKLPSTRYGVWFTGLNEPSRTMVSGLTTSGFTVVSYDAAKASYKDSRFSLLIRIPRVWNSPD